MKRIALTLAACGVLLAPTLAAAKDAAPDMTGKQEHRMANCPSAVPSSATSIIDAKDGVILTVTSADTTAVQEIQRRADMQANVAAQPARGALEHTGAGTGSGQLGFCPGMEQGSLVKVEDLGNGARIVVRAEKATDVAQLQTSTRARLRRLQAKR
jgi:TusA-related sulfurtransferase